MATQLTPAQQDAALLEALLRQIDTASPDTATVKQSLDDISGHTPGRSLDVWRHAIRYAHKRLRPVQDEIGVLHIRLLELGVVTSSYMDTISTNNHGKALQDVSAKGSLLLGDEFWLESTLSEDVLRVRLAVVASARAKREQLRATMNAELSIAMQNPPQPTMQQPTTQDEARQQQEKVMLDKLKATVDTAVSNAVQQDGRLASIVKQPNGSFQFMSRKFWNEAIRYAYARLAPVQEELNIVNARLHELINQADARPLTDAIGKGVKDRITDREAYTETRAGKSVPMLNALELVNDEIAEGSPSVFLERIARLSEVSRAGPARLHILQAQKEVLALALTSIAQRNAETANMAQQSNQQGAQGRSLSVDWHGGLVGGGGL